MKILKQMMVGAVLLASVFAGNAFAVGEIMCENVQVKNLYVQGSRTDYPSHANRILIRPVTQCGANPYLFMHLNKPEYSAILTLILNSQNTGKRLDFYVNPNEKETLDASEIIFVLQQN
ncbi:MAG: hypothetical protein OCD01_05090 [Fibrobacterales bacterium]